VFRPVSGPNDVSAVYFNTGRHIVDTDGPLGGVILSPHEVTQSLQTAHSHCCSVHSYKGQSYLVYTAPLVAGGAVIGAVQTSISEHQYLQTMDGLVRTLLIVAMLGLVGSAAVSVVMAGRALRPIRVAMQRQRDFVADAAHELRTPLAIQRTVAEVEKPEPTVEELQSTVAQMLSQNRHLTRLVEDLSLLARTDTDAISIGKAPVDLSGLLGTTSEEIGFLAAENGIKLAAEVRGGVTVVGDVVRLRQLILILLDNALKHTPPGGEIQVRLLTKGDRAVMQVSDSGTGISPADLPRVFDRFYRADEARAGEGTGLGLAIARWIVEAHGGQITASNANPHGAVFAVTLPAARVPAPV
jgi:signal transduction histidine kinase